MAFSQFLQDQFFIVVDDSDSLVPLGEIDITNNMRLSDITLRAQKVGIHTNETLTLEIHDQETVDNPMFTSATYTYDDFSFSSSHHAGSIRFSFGDCYLNAARNYWVKIRVGNYNYVEDSRYIGFELDWPDQVNTQGAGLPSAAMVIYGYID